MKTLFALTLLALACPASAQVDPRARTDQVAMLKDWATSRCLSKGLGQKTVAGIDAANSAGALLEHGRYGIEAYEALDRLVDRQLSREYIGFSGGTFVTLKCLDLRRSRELDRTIRSFRRKPATR